MANQTTFYLVDYENVHEDGLVGAESLGKNDYVHIFTSKNAPNISIKILSYFNSTNLQFHEVPASKQSVDMNIVSFLGYLIGKNDTSKIKYVVISKDTDYDNVLSFWRKFATINILKREKIKEESSSVSKEINKNAEENIQKELVTDFPANHLEITNDVSAISISSKNPKTQINCEVQKILSKAGFKNNIISGTASLVTKNYNQKNAKQVIYRSLIAKYVLEEGLKIYNQIKKLL
ncbi:MAG: hypothetical protein IJV12_04665 [Acidaminococcaceae bacterium]|nr:hypothetical protein [Acidaminococcaceae bacterium]